MAARFMFLGLELKRACKRLPFLYAGAAALAVLAGAAAFLAGKLLYGGTAVGRIPVGVVLPEEDTAAAKVMSMAGSLESVKSLCDFEYGSYEICMNRLTSGELSAVIVVPDGFVRDIMSGANTPAEVFLPSDAGIEGRVFAELARAGARTLGASQAGIYAADELFIRYGMQESIPMVEMDLNRIYLGYSLPRADYFKKIQVRATGDVGILEFYGVSLAVLSLFLCVIPVSPYLKRHSAIMRRKLALAGVGTATVTAGRILGLAFLMAGTAFPAAAAAARCGWLDEGLPVFPAAGVLLLVCLAAAAAASAVYQLAGTLMGGTMLLFFAAVGLHLLSGGFLPLIFLPVPVQKLSYFLPSAILMDNVKFLVSGEFAGKNLLRLLALAAVGFAVNYAGEAGNR